MSKETFDIDKYIIPSLISAGDILKYLSSYKTKRSKLSEITKGLNINKSTCYRLLLTLTHMNLLVYDPETKTYSLGPYLVLLGSRAAETLDYITIAKEYLQEAVKLTNNTCALVTRLDDVWYYLSKEEPDSPVRVTINVGQRFKLNNGASGKVFFAYMEYSEQQKLLNRIGFPKSQSPDNFEKELEMIREKGYAISLEEHIPGIDGVSAPIIDPSGNVQFVFTSIMLHSEQSSRLAIKTAGVLKNLAFDFSRKIYY